jgi:LemA protein
MGPLLILLILAVALVAWAIMKYNALVTLRNQVANGWKQIDVQLKRRHDLIPNLVNTVKGSMEFEQETLQKVIAARGAAVSATGVADAAAKEGVLSGALGRLFALAESYPSLKSNENVKQLQEELSSTENKIGFARQFYNDIATKFNIALQVFPGNHRGAAFRVQAIGALRDQRRGRARRPAGRSFTEEIVRFQCRTLTPTYSSSRRRTGGIPSSSWRSSSCSSDSWVSGSTCSSSVSPTGGAPFPAFR